MKLFATLSGAATLFVSTAVAAPVSVWAQQTALSAPASNADTIFQGKKGITQSAPLLLESAAGSPWNMGNRAAVEVRLRNTGKLPVTVQVRAENADASGMKNTVRTYAAITPDGKEQIVLLRLVRRPQDPTYAPFKPYFMYKKNINVYDNTVDAAAIVRMIVSVEPGAGATAASVTVSAVQATGTGTPDAPAFLPFVDKYGQYRHTDWVGKIHSDAEFADRIRQEDQEMKAYPGPADWDKWGGWATGPKQTATGHFATAKVAGKWWLVDPDGRLFFSYGPTGVGFGEGSPITGREDWFAALPPRTGNALAKYWGKGKGATYMYYQDKSYDTYDFSAAAAERKYGPNWRTVSLERLHKRLRNWGFNTLANWSSGDAIAQRKTPYVVAIHYGGPKIYRMPDVYDPGFAVALRERMATEKNRTADDAWNIGYFVDNELWWGPAANAQNVAHSVLKAAPNSASKAEFVKDLQAKYSAVAELNAVWGTEYASWDALRQSTDLPSDTKRAADDCGAFGLKFADRYFATVRGIVKETAPNTLYLGCRFHGHIDTAVIQVAAKYCDVIGYNVYDPKPGDRLNRFVGVVDKPFIVGEFGVGSDALQSPFRGEQLEEKFGVRVENLEAYLNNAFTQPLLVGAHFFQFRDQPLTGRPDGEATLRGFVDTTDTPHFDLVQANRRVAYDLYKRRAGLITTAQAKKP